MQLLTKYSALLRLSTASQDRIAAVEQTLAERYGELTDEQAINVYDETIIRGATHEGPRTAMLRRYWELTEGPASDSVIRDTHDPRIYRELIVALAEIPPSAMGPEYAALLRELGNVALPTSVLADKETIIARTIAQGTPPSGVADLIQQFSADTDRSYTQAGNDSIATHRANSQLKTYACQYAAAGDYEGARKLWLAMNSPSAMLYTMSFCLDHVTSASQRHAFRPNELQELLHPGITHAWRMYESRAAADKNRLAAELRDFVGEYRSAAEQTAEFFSQFRTMSETPLFNPPYDLANTVVSMLKDIGQEEGLPLLRELHVEVKQREEQQADANFKRLSIKLYNLLIEWGDTATVRQHYAEVMKGTIWEDGMARLRGL